MYNEKETVQITTRRCLKMSKKKRTSEKDREEYGYGYDRSVDDLKVMGENKKAKNHKRNADDSVK